jgi:hypothetical protein
MNSKTFINRRKFLRGLGGAAVAAPFLASVAEQEAKAQGMTSTDPKRLIVFFTHYGCLTDRWFPKVSHGQLATADYMNMDTLSVMAPHASKLLMVRGIRAMNEWSFNGALGQTTDPHTQPCGSYFTCQPVTPDNGKFTATPTGRSLDHVVAEQINPNGGDPLFVQIGGNFASTSNTQNAISYSDAMGTLFPGVSSPQQIYSSLTGLFGKGTTTNADTWANASGNSIVDIISDDLSALQKVSMSGADQQKLSDWKDLLTQTSGTMSAMCTQSVADGIVTSAQVKTASGGGGLSNDISKVVDVMYDLTLLNAICDANRVIFLKFPPNYVFSFLSYMGSAFTVESHSLSHRIGNANMGGTCISGVMDMLHMIDQWYAQQFSNLVGKLDSFMEGSGTVLDNSATVWFQEMSDGDSHNLNNLPILQAGSCGGYFKTGWAINVENTSGSDSGGTPNASMSVGNSDGDCQNGSTLPNLDNAGTTPSTVANQPINKYFCNLMNAVGVKADSTGFPVKGGTMPVTHYGKYDQSKLFNGGGTAAASIIDPGEYTILKAGT